jgi:beta-lactamase class A
MRHLALLVIFLLMSLDRVPVIQAQYPSVDFDSLPDCGFTADTLAGLQIGAVIYNFETGVGCTQNLDVVFPVASILKILVSGAYYQAVSQSALSPSQTMRYDENYHMGGNNACLNEWDIGRDIPLRELSDIMITCSDNAATWMLMDAIGWDAVQAYVNSLGIPDMGAVLPYAFVDRLKLMSIDSTWEQVPAAMASRFWRGRDTTGLSDYFRPLPRIERGQIQAANRYYFDNYTYNTASPRALATYFVQLRNDYLTTTDRRWDIANGVLGEMLNTQRQYSTQAFPGSVYIGAKNGFDSGLVAEANFTLSQVERYNRAISGIAIVFTFHPNGGANRTTLNQYLWDLSPQIADVLYPDYQEPTLATNWTINTVRFSTPDAIDNCWYAYRDSNFNPAFVSDFELCLGRIPQGVSFRNGQEMALGLVLRGLNYQDTRLTFIYTAPDGTRRSYQTRVPMQNDVGVNWFHPVDMRGTWTLDIYVNLELGYSGSFEVGI